MFDLTESFGTLVGFAALVVALAELLFGEDGVIKPLSGQQAKYASWGLAVALGILADALGLGVFGQVVSPGVMDFWAIEGAILGFVGGLLANGVFGIDTVKMLLEVLKMRTPPNIG